MTNVLSDEGRPPRFATTRWSLVLRAGEQEGEAARRSLETLCQQYWLPLYAFMRRQVPQTADAQDLTQAFFARLIEKQILVQADPERGRFRTFLMAAAQNFLTNERDRQRAKKRGGGQFPLTLDFSDGESRIGRTPVDQHGTPERLFERQWALVLLDAVLWRLSSEYEVAGHGPQFAVLKAAITGERAHNFYHDAAAQLGISTDAARQSASRMRKRYRAILREEVGQTVATTAEIDDEIRQLFTVLGS